MRKAKIIRKTKETDIELFLNIDGKGKYNIDTSIGFLDHMLELFVFHSKFDLKLKSKGDTKIDQHHLVEDIGICLGEAFKKTIGDKNSINRYGNFLMPMDEALSFVVVDISGRPYLKYNVKFKPQYKKENFDFDLIEDFLNAFTNSAFITLHISLKYGRNNHHIVESIFKGFALALSQAVKITNKRKKIPSTKGSVFTRIKDCK